MKIVRPVLHVALFLVSGSLLAGCDKLKEVDSKVAASQQEITDLKAEVASSNRAIAALKSEIADVRAKMTNLEAGRKGEANNDQRQSLSSEEIAGLKQAVAQCVTRVRASAPAGNEQFYTGFDAYYNPASGRVMNNVQYNGQVPALYAFNKCMASQGFPLS
ncbi:hypothetical protein PQQ77_15375 [Paraburkholderia strydomiana]|uniref:hypothetical protein n=1 Tax=Paraburkholderia strydomiana TaxID=1245417 RepID=UPI0038B8A21D